jgi:hypothetical protein
LKGASKTPCLLKASGAKLFLAILFGALLAARAVPGAAFAATVDPADTDTGANITMEYHYAEGDRPQIPQTINEFGEEYRLVSQSAPAAERDLPVTRHYTFRVNGVVSGAELDLAERRWGVKLNLEEVNLPFEREVDKTEVIDGLGDNDVDAIPATKTYQVASTGSSGGFADVVLARAAVKYEVTATDDGLPSEYRATVTYRGVESYSETAYYLAGAVYETSSVESMVARYVIIAVYAPTSSSGAAAGAPGVSGGAGAPGETSSGAASGTASSGTASSGAASGGAASGAQDGAGAAEQDGGGQTGLESQADKPTVDIVENEVPREVGSQGSWSILSMMLAFCSAVAAIFLVLGLMQRRKDGRAAESPEEVDAAETDAPGVLAKLKRVRVPGKRQFANLMEILAIIAGFPALAVWLLSDDLTGAMMWLSDNTVRVGICFVAHIVVFAVYKISETANANLQRSTD